MSARPSGSGRTHIQLSTPHGGGCGFTGTPPNLVKQTGISAAPGPCNPGLWFPCANSSLPHHSCVLIPAADTAPLLSVPIAGRWTSVPAWPSWEEDTTCPTPLCPTSYADMSGLVQDLSPQREGCGGIDRSRGWAPACCRTPQLVAGRWEVTSGKSEG